MKFFVVFLSIFITSLYAADSFERVLITKTSKKSNLKNIKHKLDALKVKMYVQSIPSGYYVYSPKFTNKEESRACLQKLKRSFPYAKIITIGDKSTSSKLSSDDASSHSASKHEGKYFVNLGVGSANTEGSTNDANASQLENSSTSYKLELGYFYTDNIAFSVTYLDTSSSDISILNYYTSANYRLSLMDKLDGFAGISLGFTTLELDTYPLSSASSSALFGAQIGISYDVLDDLSIFTSFESFLVDHTINLVDNGSKIEFSQTNNFTFGVGYRF